MDKDATMVLMKIVKESFKRGHKFEITQVDKATGEDHAYIASSNLTRAKEENHQVSSHH